MSNTWEIVAPTRRWITITDAEIAAGNAFAPVVRALVNNEDFIRQVNLGPDKTSVTSVPHTHEGTDTPWLEVSSYGRNLLTNSAIDYFAHGNWWPRAKHSKKKAPHVYPTVGYGFHFDGIENAHVWTIPTTRSDLTKVIWGQGATVNASCFVKLLGTATQGEFSFGFATSQGWIEGARFAVDYSDLSTTHIRAYGVCTISPTYTESGAYTDGTSSNAELGDLSGPRFELRITEAFDCGLEVTACQVSLGETLHWWVPSRMDAHSGGNEHDDWYNYGLQSCPAWETSIAFTNALRLYGV